VCPVGLGHGALNGPVRSHRHLHDDRQCGAPQGGLYRWRLPKTEALGEWVEQTGGDTDAKPIGAGNARALFLPTGENVRQHCTLDPRQRSVVNVSHSFIVS